MKLYGTLSQIVAAIFRKDSNNITLRPNQSVTYNADRDVQLPEENANSVLVSKTSPDVLTNKSISGSTNTLSNIPNNATTATDANTPSAIVARNASGNFSAGTITADLVGNASTATSATSATSFTGSLSGEVTGTQSATVVADNVIDNDNIKSTAAIAYSKLALTGSILNADLAGSIEDSKLNTISTVGKVANSATTATPLYTALNPTPNTIVSRDGSGGTSLGGLGVTGNLTTNNFEATGQSLMKFAYINGSTGQGFIEMEGQQVGDIVAPTSGEARLFAGTDGKIYVRKKGSSQAEELGAGGSGEINLVDNSSDAGNWGVVNATATTNTTAANNPLSGTIDTSIAIASSTSGGYARYRFSMPSALKQRKLKLEWYQIASSLTSGAYRVEVWTNASSDYSGAYTELSLSTDSSGTSSIPNLNGKYSTTFDTNGSDYYEIRVVRTAASAATIYIANVVCGPGIQPQGAVVGPSTSYTLTIGATTTAPTPGTNTSVASYVRMGDMMKLNYSFKQTTLGSSGGNGIYLFPLPPGLTIDSTRIGASGEAGNSVFGAAQINNNTSTLTGVVLPYGSTNLMIQVLNDATAPSLVSSTFYQVSTNATLRYTFEAMIPIAEWAGSGTVQLAQNDVEYASNNAAVGGTGSNDTSSFVYGPNGSTIGSITATLNRTVQFQTPIQVGDVLTLQVKNSAAGSQWVDVASAADGGIPVGLQYQNAAVYGLGIFSTSGTQAVVRFGQYAYNTSTYGAAGTTWATDRGTWSWRVRKASAGAAVGFGLYQPGVSAGLVSASGLPGNTTGNAIASGYVGQVITATSSTKTPNVQDAWHDFTGNSVTLTPGVWQLFGNIAFDNPGTSPGYKFYWGAWCTTAGNNTTTLPTLLTPSAGLNNIQIDMGTQSFPKLFMTMSNIIHRVSSDTTVYLNASSNQANGTNARVTCILTAVRIA